MFKVNKVKAKTKFPKWSKHLLNIFFPCNFLLDKTWDNFFLSNLTECKILRPG
jgi:hypothetical protein